MEIVALVLAAFLQLVSLSVDQLRETVDAIKAALVAQYVDATEGQRLAGAAAVQSLLQRESRDRHLLLWPGAPADILKIVPGGRLQMFVSAGRTFDPRSGSGWQVEGVRPDREAPASEALDVALRLASAARASR
jgi:hypothetical protein